MVTGVRADLGRAGQGSRGVSRISRGRAARDERAGPRRERRPRWVSAAAEPGRSAPAQSRRAPPRRFLPSRIIRRFLPPCRARAPRARRRSLSRWRPASSWRPRRWEWGAHPTFPARRTARRPGPERSPGTPTAAGSASRMETAASGPRAPAGCASTIRRRPPSPATGSARGALAGASSRRPGRAPPGRATEAPAAGADSSHVHPAVPRLRRSVAAAVVSSERTRRGRGVYAGAA